MDIRFLISSLFSLLTAVRCVRFFSPTPSYFGFLINVCCKYYRMRNSAFKVLRNLINVTIVFTRFCDTFICKKYFLGNIMVSVAPKLISSYIPPRTTCSQTKEIFPFSKVFPLVHPRYREYYKEFRVLNANY